MKEGVFRDCPDISLSGLRALESTVRLGTLAKAAEELGISPAAVTQSLRRLEFQLGVVLFERSGGGRMRLGMRPTHSALRLVSELPYIFAQLRSLIDGLTDKPVRK
jgi:molybdate transport repressor ModE-like protein